ncbi:MAG: TIGR00730 family Rossman fold protein [Candidatus Parcubacteria bacterium]|nr:TIGR00730 family Rossman fold protein [Candidatus Parcubacteria bacterium]
MAKTINGSDDKNGHQFDSGDFRGTITWRIFRIMAEFVEGFQFLASLKKTVSILGSHTLATSDPYYQEACDLGEMLGRGGFTVITGGGQGVMEAANKGAAKVKAPSVGLNIQLPPPEGEMSNPYLNKSVSFHYFFTRKVMFSFSAQAYVFFPGGYGTLDEFTEILCLVQTHKIKKVPIILMDKDFWQPFVEWVKKEILPRNMVSPEDLNLFYIVDSAEEAYDIIKKTPIRKVDLD